MDANGSFFKSIVKVSFGSFGYDGIVAVTFPRGGGAFSFRVVVARVVSRVGQRAPLTVTRLQ